MIAMIIVIVIVIILLMMIIIVIMIIVTKITTVIIIIIMISTTLKCIETNISRSCNQSMKYHSHNNHYHTSFKTCITDDSYKKKLNVNTNKKKISYHQKMIIFNANKKNTKKKIQFQIIVI